MAPARPGPRPSSGPPLRLSSAPRLAAIATEARTWCRGRPWWWRAPIVLYSVWLLVHRLRDPMAGSFFSAITLGFHELGHLVFFWAGPAISIPAGSAAQVAVPIVAAAALFRQQRDWFGVSFAGTWLASALFELAAYVGDARAREIPLVGLFPDPVHDWNWILSHLGILSWDHALAGILRALSFGIGVAAAAAGAWLCYEMARGSGLPPAPIHGGEGE